MPPVFEIEDHTNKAPITDEALRLHAQSKPMLRHRGPTDADLVASALIGPCGILHEIYYDGETAYYYANNIRVPREVYMDSIHTAERDVYCPECDEIEDALPVTEKPKAVA